MEISSYALRSGLDITGQDGSPKQELDIYYTY